MPLLVVFGRFRFFFHALGSPEIRYLLTFACFPVNNIQNSPSLKLCHFLYLFLQSSTSAVIFVNDFRLKVIIDIADEAVGIGVVLRKGFLSRLQECFAEVVDLHTRLDVILLSEFAYNLLLMVIDVLSIFCFSGYGDDDLVCFDRIDDGSGASVGYDEVRLFHFFLEFRFVHELLVSVMLRQIITVSCLGEDLFGDRACRDEAVDCLQQAVELELLRSEGYKYHLNSSRCSVDPADISAVRVYTSKCLPLDVEAVGVFIQETAGLRPGADLGIGLDVNQFLPM